MQEKIHRDVSYERGIIQLRCPFHRHGRNQLGSQISAAGVVVWCKDCRRGHLLSWQELEEVRRLVAFPEDWR